MFFELEMWRKSPSAAFQGDCSKHMVQQLWRNVIDRW